MHDGRKEEEGRKKGEGRKEVKKKLGPCAPYF
jgi:hypothetical protein